MRVGRVIRMIREKSFGFIRADEFREDVFFHFSCVDRNTHPDQWPDELEVEFELNELLRIDEGKLQASLVRPATRPRAVAIDEIGDKVTKAKHHPKARQRKPIWREKRQPEP